MLNCYHFPHKDIDVVFSPLIPHGCMQLMNVGITAMTGSSRIAANATAVRPTLRGPIARYQPLVMVLAAACVGILADRQTWSFVPHSFELWWCISAAALGTWFVLSRTDRSSAAVMAILVSVAAADAAWYHARWNLFDRDEIGRFATQSPQPICLEAIAESAPRDVPQPAFDPLRSIPATPQSRLVVNVVGVRDGQQWRTATGRTQVSIGGQLESVHAGDRLRIFGQLATPTPAANPGEFDFALYARANRELSTVRVKLPACVTVLETGSMWNPTRWFDVLRNKGDQLLSSYISAERAGTAAAVLLGQREEVDRETNEAYLETGTVHILVVAGLHVGILAWLLFKAMRVGWMSRRTALASVMIVTGMYMMLTNAGPSVVRATLLVWIVCGGLWLGRSRIGLNSLAFAGLVLLVVNPANLFQTGVQLSFLSVAALMWAAMHFTERPKLDPLDRLIFQTRPWPQKAAWRFGQHLRDVFLAGGLLWLVITPLTMARFHLFSPAGLVLNLLLIPVLMIVMAAGFGVLAFGWWLPPLAAVFGWVCNLGLHILDASVKWAANLPGGRFWVAGPNDGWLAVFYLAVATAIFPLGNTRTVTPSKGPSPVPST
jgi:competence protein ComEC